MLHEDARCFSREKPFPISLQHQAVFCLDPRFSDCSRFRPRAAALEIPIAASESTSRYTLSLITLLIAIGAGAALAVAVVGNPLAVEPDSHATPTSAVQPRAAATAAGTPPGLAPVAVTPVVTIAATPPAAIPPTATAMPLPSPAATVTYTVQPGDSLSALARRYGISVTELATANGLKPTSGLLIGQILKIPAAESPTPASP